MTLSTQQTTVGGATKNLLVGLDGNGSLAPAHVLANSSGVEAGTATNPISVAVVGTPATQPVSLASLPLPAGAAADGTDATGVTPPPGGAGIRGWLSGLYATARALLTVEQPYQGVVPMTVGTAYAAQRAIRINCSTAGNVSLTYVDGSTDVVPVNAGLSYIAGAFTAVNSAGTTAAATYANVK